MRFRAKVRREGHALKIYIPKDVWQALGIQVGDEVEVSISTEPLLRDEIDDLRQKIEEIEDKLKDLEKEIEEVKR